MFLGLIGTIRSTRTARSERGAKPRNIQFVSWAGRANTDAWYLSQLEQSRNRALIYYAKNQIR